MLLIDSFTSEKYCYKRLTVWMDMDHHMDALNKALRHGCFKPYGELRRIMPRPVVILKVGPKNCS